LSEESFRCFLFKMESNGDQISKKKSRLTKYYKLNEFEQRSFGRLKKNFHMKKNNFYKNLTDRNFYQNLLLKRIPILSWLPIYKLKSYLLADFMAGLTIGIMNIPQVY
jgi:hypothetical protein